MIFCVDSLYATTTLVDARESIDWQVAKKGPCIVLHTSQKDLKSQYLRWKSTLTHPLRVRSFGNADDSHTLFDMYISLVLWTLFFTLISSIVRYQVQNPMRTPHQG
jgi:hypothetical protein